MAGKNSFLHSLAVQKRVVSALFLREIITRYGRNNIGFLWLFMEPLLITSVILTIWGFFRADTMYGLPVIPFVITGYPLTMMWRNSSNRCIGAISANAGLLFHRNVKIIDLHISRSLLEISGCTIAFIVIFLCMYVFGLMEAPSNILLMIFAWFLMAWFSISLGFVIGILSEKFEAFGNIWRPISFMFFFISGVFFLVDALPIKAQQILLYVPMVHGTEMFRHGYFGDVIQTHESIAYLVLINTTLLFLGLILSQYYGKRVEPT